MVSRTVSQVGQPNRLYVYGGLTARWQNSTVGIQSVQNIRDALEDIQEKVAGSLTAVRFLDSNAAGFDLGVACEWAGKDCSVFKGFRESLIHQNIMQSFCPAGATRVVLDVNTLSDSGLTPESGDAMPRYARRTSLQTTAS
jgi:hypothetical protein